MYPYTISNIYYPTELLDINPQEFFNNFIIIKIGLTQCVYIIMYLNILIIE